MTQSELIKLIEQQSSARKIAPATLCRLAVGNNRLLKNLKTGRSCTLDVAERMVAYIDENPINQSAAAAE